MENSNEICLVLSEGKIFKQQLIRSELSVNEDAVFAKIRNEAPLKVENLFMLEDGVYVDVSFNMDGGMQHYMCSFYLSEIILTTDYRLNDGIMTPIFNRVPDKGSPTLPLKWFPGLAGNILVLMLVDVIKEDGVYMAKEHYLVACENGIDYWKLPLPNVYADCKICTGTYISRSDTVQGTLKLALAQFRQSNWNSDLLEQPEKTRMFFRFKPVENEFVTMPVDGDWTKLCQRVSIPQLSHLIP